MDHPTIKDPEYKLIEKVLRKLDQGEFSDLNPEEELCFYRMVFEQIEAAIYLNYLGDANDLSSARLVWINQFGERQMGISLKEAQQMGPRLYEQTLDPADRDIPRQSVDFMKLRKGDCFRGMYRQKPMNGESYWCYTTCRVVGEKDGLPSHFLNAQLAVDDEWHTISQLLELQKENLRLKHQLSLQRLTPREKEIVVFLAKGYSDKEIARDLNLSVETTRTHHRNILRKLNMKKTAEVAVFASESGLL